MIKTKNSIDKVLITGAAGFIGSHLTRKLIKEGFKVGIIKKEDSDTWRITDLLDEIAVYDADLRDTPAVSKAISHFRPDAIIHLATYYAVEHKPEEISLMIDTNVLGTINLLESSKESGVKLFVNTSSCFVYRQSKSKLTEDDDLEPINLYALTKLQSEQACTFYAEKYGLSVVTFRLFPPYGPADHGRRLIPHATRNLLEGKRLELTSGKQKWDFVYVGDIVEAYSRLLNIPNLPKKHEIFNVGTENAFSVREVVSKIKDVVDADLEPAWDAIPHRKNEVWFMCADMCKTKKFLGWQPKVRILDEGLDLTVKWYKNVLKKEDKNGEDD